MLRWVDPAGQTFRGGPPSITDNCLGGPHAALFEPSVAREFAYVLGAPERQLTGQPRGLARWVNSPEQRRVGVVYSECVRDEAPIL